MSAEVMRPNILSTQQVADMLGTDVWRVRRLFEDGMLPEPGRFAGKRAISGQSLPEIVDALRKRGWLSSSTEDSRDCADGNRELTRSGCS